MSGTSPDTMDGSCMLIWSLKGCRMLWTIIEIEIYMKVIHIINIWDNYGCLLWSMFAVHGAQLLETRRRLQLKTRPGRFLFFFKTIVVKLSWESPLSQLAGSSNLKGKYDVAVRSDWDVERVDNRLILKRMSMLGFLISNKNIKRIIASYMLYNTKWSPCIQPTLQMLFLSILKWNEA